MRVAVVTRAGNCCVLALCAYDMSKRGTNGLDCGGGCLTMAAA